MNATLSVDDIEAQIHTLSQEDKLRIARYVEQEIGSTIKVDADLPEWVKEELERRERLLAEGKMEVYPWEEVRERLLNHFQK